jgi:hypothetical protein
LGFADSKNQKLEEKRSPEGLKEVEKELSHSKKPLQKQKKQEETVSNALQWRLQYGRAIGVVGTIEGVEDLLA